MQKELSKFYDFESHSSSVEQTGNDGNSLHTQSSGFRRNPPLLLEGNKRNDFSWKTPADGGTIHELSGDVTPPDFVPMYRDSATPLKGGGIGEPPLVFPSFGRRGGQAQTLTRPLVLSPEASGRRIPECWKTEIANLTYLDTK